MVAKNRKKKRPFKNILFYVFLIFSCSVVAGFLFVANWKIYSKRIELAQKGEVLMAGIDKLESRNKELKKRSEYVGTEAYLEEIARNELDMKKPGEEVVFIQNEAEEEKEEVKEKKSWWDKLRGFLK